MNIKKEKLFIISGPSGAGEDSVIEGLKDFFPIERVITTTCREIRPEETNGNPYYFISKEEFKDKIDKNEFFEYACQYNDNYYGVTKEEIERVSKSGKIGIWKIEYKGVLQAKELIPNIKAILISAPTEILEERLRQRGMDEEKIKERTEYNIEWYKNKDIYDYEVENEQGKLDETIEEVVAIIRKESK